MVSMEGVQRVEVSMSKMSKEDRQREADILSKATQEDLKEMFENVSSFSFSLDHMPHCLVISRWEALCGVVGDTCNWHQQHICGVHQPPLSSMPCGTVGVRALQNRLKHSPANQPQARVDVY